MRSELGLERRVHPPRDFAFPRHLSSASSSALEKQGAFTGLWQSMVFLWKCAFPTVGRGDHRELRDERLRAQVSGSRPVALPGSPSLLGLNLRAMVSGPRVPHPGVRLQPHLTRVFTCRGSPASHPPGAGCPAGPGVSSCLLHIFTSYSPAQRAVGPGADRLSVLPGGRG